MVSEKCPPLQHNTFGVKSFSHPFQAKRRKNNKKVFCFGEHPKKQRKKQNTKQGRRTICGVMAFMVFSDVYDPQQRDLRVFSPPEFPALSEERYKLRIPFCAIIWMNFWMSQTKNSQKTKEKKQDYFEPKPTRGFLTKKQKKGQHDV